MSVSNTSEIPLTELPERTSCASSEVRVLTHGEKAVCNKPKFGFGSNHKFLHGSGLGSRLGSMIQCRHCKLKKIQMLLRVSATARRGVSAASLRPPFRMLGAHAHPAHDDHHSHENLSPEAAAYHATHPTLFGEVWHAALSCAYFSPRFFLTATCRAASRADCGGVGTVDMGAHRRNRPTRSSWLGAPKHKPP